MALDLRGDPERHALPVRHADVALCEELAPPSAG